MIAVANSSISSGELVDSRETGLRDNPIPRWKLELGCVRVELELSLLCVSAPGLDVSGVRYIPS